jgi:hypothetical protein
MKARDRKIRRIADVQARLHRIAEWQLLECQARENELNDRQRRIIEAFNDEGHLPELAAETASRNLRVTSVEQGTVAKKKGRLAAHALGEARKLKHALRMVQVATSRAFRDDEKRTLEAEVEKTVTRPGDGV